MITPYEQRSKAKLAATIATVLVIAGLVIMSDYVRSHDRQSTATAQVTPSTSMSAGTSNAQGTTSSTDHQTAAGTFKDGTYAASSSYYVPNGQEQIRVNLTIQNGVITDSTIQNSENDFDSQRYQEDFSATYKSKIVGKNIDGLQLSVIAGASDTTQGFNDALKKITSQARA